MVEVVLGKGRLSFLLFFQLLGSLTHSSLSNVALLIFICSLSNVAILKNEIEKNLYISVKITKFFYIIINKNIIKDIYIYIAIIKSQAQFL